MCMGTYAHIQVHMHAHTHTHNHNTHVCTTKCARAHTHTHRDLPAGCLWGCHVWMSMGKWRRVRTVSSGCPLNLLALLMLLVYQSVQYSSSSNSVNAKGWGKPKHTQTSALWVYITAGLAVSTWTTMFTITAVTQFSQFLISKTQFVKGGVGVGVGMME